MKPDKVRVENHLSIVLLRPLTKGARKWMEDNIAAEPWAWMGGAVACEPRYVADIVDGMMDEGIEVISGL